jgi:hypothetical protein
VCDGSAQKKNACKFGRAWIITNTKFSEHAKQYASAKNIRLTGWRYPEKDSFEALMDKKIIYPLTVLSARKEVIDRLFGAGVITLQDMNQESLERAGIAADVSKKLLDQKRKLLE